jgi:hypothetical protein
VISDRNGAAPVVEPGILQVEIDLYRKEIMSRKRIAPIVPIAIVIVLAGVLMLVGNAARSDFREGIADIQQADVERATLLEVAMSTGRIGLGTVTADMAAWEREMNDLEVPNNLETYREATLLVGIKGREMILAFMSGDENTDLSQEIAAAAEAAEARDGLYPPLEALASKNVFEWGLRAIF